MVDVDVRVQALATNADVPVSAIQAIADKARHNLRRLESCAYHEFEQDPHTAILRSISHQAYVCRHCGGSIDWEAHRWFIAGRKPKPDR
jgi:predicted transcriptional regulator